jgi:hypothetical protein
MGYSFRRSEVVLGLGLLEGNVSSKRRLAADYADYTDVGGITVRFDAICLTESV